MAVLRLLVLVLSASFSAVLVAQESDIVASDEINIERDDEATYYEHRVNGVLKEIKVVPKVGPEYFLVPADGGGWIREDRSTLLIPKWVLFEW